MGSRRPVGDPADRWIASTRIFRSFIVISDKDGVITQQIRKNSF
jgi:hypothetical protein